MTTPEFLSDLGKSGGGGCGDLTYGVLYTMWVTIGYVQGRLDGPQWLSLYTHGPRDIV